MVQASGPSGILGNYYYNADGLRVAKVTAAGTVGFLYDGQKLLLEVGATGQTTATYTSSGGNVYDPLVGIANAAGSHALLMDGLGSIRFLLDNTQRFSDGYVYEAFGRQVSGGGLTPNPYHFVGEYGYYRDSETGLMLLTRRYYDAEVGGFVTRDPIGFGGGDWNTYGYVRGRVTGRTDALGLQDPVTIVVVVVIVVLLGGCSGQGGGKKPTPAPTPPKHTYTLKDITNILTTAGGYVGPAVGSDLSNVANPDFFCMEVIALVQRYGAQAEKMMDEGDTAEMQKDEAVVARGQALLDICKARQSK